MTRRVWLALGIGLLCVTIAGFFIARKLGAGAAPAVAAVEAAPAVALAIAHTGTFVERVNAQGRIGPPAGSSAKLAFPQPGTLRALDVRVGERVAAGQAVAALDRATLASTVAQAEADARTADAGYGGGRLPSAAARSARAKLAVAEARLQTLAGGGPAASSDRISATSAARQAALKVSADRAAVERARILFGGGVVARKDLDAARAQLDADIADQSAADAKVAAASAGFTASLASARADVASARSDLVAAQAQDGVLGGQAQAARARLESARIAYTNGVIVAPSDGVVLAILKHPGESVDASTPVIEIGPDLAGTVTLTVPGDLAQRIVVGDSASLEVPQAPLPPARGHVTAVVPAVDPATQSATVIVGGAPAAAVPGDAVTATIDVARLDGIIVPSAAIVQDPQTGRTVVFVRREHPGAGDSAYVMRDVAVRASDAATAVLGSGLKVGERVAAQGAYTLLAPAGG